MFGKPALQSKPKKRLSRKKESFISNHHTYFILLISWGACSQSALPLKSYRGADHNPIQDSRCIDRFFLVLFSSKPPEKVHPHMIWQCTVFVPHLVSMCLDSFWTAVPLQTSITRNAPSITTVHCEAFGQLLFIISSSRLQIVTVSFTAACSCTSEIPSVLPSCATH